MRHSFLILIFVIFLKGALVALLTYTSAIRLYPDEAQYWLWSRYLDWGYYSKPAGIAYWLALHRMVFGEGEMAIRIASQLVGLFLPLAVYYLAKKLFDEKSALFAAIAFAISPLGFLSSFSATTDPLAALFLTLFAAEGVTYFQRRTERSLQLASLYGGVAMLFKWPPLLFFIPFFFLASIRGERKSQLFLSLLLFSLGSLPTLYWNATHGWPTFHHVGQAMASVGEGKGGGGNFFDFLGAQLLLLHPLLFGLLLMAIWRGKKEPLREERAQLLLLATLFLVVIGAMSCLKKMQGNWGVMAYPLLFPFIGAMLVTMERWRSKLLLVVTGSSFFVMAFLFYQPTLAEKGIIPLALKLNPLKKNVGWQRMEEALAIAGYDKPYFLFSDNYQISSLLAFYGDQTRRPYLLNIAGARENQFFHWPGLEVEQVGESGFYLCVKEGMAPHCLEPLIRAKKDQLAPYFREVQWRAVVPLYRSPFEEKIALIFLCEGYNGLVPPSSGRF